MMKVMIVDDDDNVARCLDSFINWDEIGYSVTGRASNGLEALKLMHEDVPDVLITDLKMPVMGGSELCQHVFEMAEDVAVIFLSAYEDFTTAKLAMKYNVTEYILKPITRQKLLSLKAVLIDLARSHEQHDIFNGLIGNSEKRREIEEKLEHGDREWFDSLFNKLLECTAEKYLLIRDVSYMMIDIIYNYLARIGIDSMLVDEKRRKSSEELDGLRMKMDMISYVSQMYSDVMQFIGQRGADSNKLIINQVKEYIMKEYTNPVFGVAEVAERFHFSADYISKLFNKYEGMAINPYISYVRVQSAVKLLAETDKLVTDIAAETGYSNLNYFTRVFKKQMNMTPLEYRNMAWNMKETIKEDSHALED